MDEIDLNYQDLYWTLLGRGLLRENILILENKHKGLKLGSFLNLSNLAITL